MAKMKLLKKMAEHLAAFAVCVFAVVVNVFVISRIWSAWQLAGSGADDLFMAIIWFTVALTILFLAGLVE